MDDAPFPHEPGSPEAIAEGCTCPPQDGPGAVTAPDGRPCYVCDQECPMHGIEVVKRAIEAGAAQVIRDEGEAETEPAPTIH